MARTTLNIDTPILREVRALQEKEGSSLSKIVTELLTEALAQRKTPCTAPTLVWHSQPMRALVDIADKEALYAILDQDGS